MSQMPDKIWLHKDTKYSTSDEVFGYQYEFAQGIEDEGGIKNFVEYVPIDAFIDKACEYMRNHIDRQLTIYHEQTWKKRDEFIEDFKKTMEDKL